MKDFLMLVLNLSIVVFALAGVLAFVNFAFGTNIGFKGASVPGDPMIGVLAFGISGICYGVNYWTARKEIDKG